MIHIYLKLFGSLVRPILAFASCVWSPFYEVHIKPLESVQKQFVLFALKSLNWDLNINLPSHSHRLKLSNLHTLSSRREMLNVVFLRKLINGVNDSHFLLSRFVVDLVLYYFNFNKFYNHPAFENIIF